LEDCSRRILSSRPSCPTYIGRKEGRKGERKEERKEGDGSWFGDIQYREYF
jgi:hypothetical protein